MARVLRSARPAWVLLLVTALVAVLGLSPPSVGDGPHASGYDPARAAELLERLCVEPRPTGSAANAAARATLVEELRGMGLEPSYVFGRAAYSDPGWQPEAPLTAPIRLAHGPINAPGMPGDLEVPVYLHHGLALVNLVVDLPGDPGAPYVLLTAHHDSVDEGPGAGDDGAGVVSLLEVLRLVKDEPRKNGLRVLITDGEERGLLGAKLYARHPAHQALALQQSLEYADWGLVGPHVLGIPTQEICPLLDADPTALAAELAFPDRLADVACVLNLEAIGNGGPALLFESGPGSGALVEAWSEVAGHATGNSLAGIIYRWMPNDTDLSIYRDRGLAGLNFAIAGGSGAYHTPSDTAANLDPASLAHMAETTLALTRHLLNTELEVGESVEPRAYVGLAPFGAVVWTGRPHLVVGLAALILTLILGRAWLAPRRLLSAAGSLALLLAATALAAAATGGLAALLAWPFLPLSFGAVNLWLLVPVAGGLVVMVRLLTRLGPATRAAARAGAVILWFLLLLAFVPGDLDLVGAAYPLVAASAGLALATALRTRALPPLVVALPLAPVVFLLAPIGVHLVQLATRSMTAAVVLATIQVTLGASLLLVVVEERAPGAASN